MNIFKLENEVTYICIEDNMLYRLIDGDLWIYNQMIKLWSPTRGKLTKADVVKMTFKKYEA